MKQKTIATRHLRTKIAAVAFFRKNDYFYVVKEHKASKM